MADTHRLARHSSSGSGKHMATKAAIGTGHEEHRSHFWRHFAEMVAVMVAGMLAGAAIFLSIVGLTWNEAIVRYPSASLIVMAVSMTVPMVAWMRHRGHGWRSTSEMAGAMIVLVIPFLCLVWFHVTESALCGLYCALMIPAMLGVMFYRRSDYSMAM